ncbi:TfuA-like protein [Vibrio ostreicida]|uniref:TfuA-like protein n=1 Tax=Vibrio ostreicida TaxID=526588 RepID=A0ABT8BWE2_9VIBR|nr:TfuA-like protein [Vibrio ostreicida]MDN3610405.1 TfuA-like protein [Vibrio ostreicida]NPD07585.1 TfuA-related McrA-glycine thioamidation protein [Vibrio ostreicida]
MAIIFIGPSLPNGEVANWANAGIEIRPPIERGDLEDISASDSPVCIIDGVFQNTLAITAREIARALKKGVRIYGSSSMGALRAAECAPIGMTGVGKIFEHYRSGEYQSDADVALTYDPISFDNITTPLVNIKYGFAQAEKAGVINHRQRAQLIRLAKGIHFSELTYEHVITLAAPHCDRHEITSLKQFIKDNQLALDLKRQDALQLIAIINNESTFIKQLG